MKKKLEIDSPPEDKLAALKEAAEYFNSDFTSLICRDEKGGLVSVSVYAVGDAGTALERWLNRRDRKEKRRASHS